MTWGDVLLWAALIGGVLFFARVLGYVVLWVVAVMGTVFLDWLWLRKKRRATWGKS